MTLHVATRLRARAPRRSPPWLLVLAAGLLLGGGGLLFLGGGEDDRHLGGMVSAAACVLSVVRLVLALRQVPRTPPPVDVADVFD